MVVIKIFFALLPAIQAKVGDHNLPYEMNDNRPQGRATEPETFRVFLTGVQEDGTKVGPTL